MFWVDCSGIPGFWVGGAPSKKSQIFGSRPSKQARFAPLPPCPPRPVGGGNLASKNFFWSKSTQNMRFFVNFLLEMNNLDLIIPYKVEEVSKLVSFLHFS